MTRFEALGLLPNKRITAYVRQSDGRLKQIFVTDPVRFVDELPSSIVDIRLTIRHSQPELGHLVKITFYRPDKQTFSTGYFKTDKRKLKRMVKRFGWKLPQPNPINPVSPERSE